MIRNTVIIVIATLMLASIKPSFADDGSAEGSAKLVVEQTIDKVLKVIAEPDFKTEGAAGEKHNQVLAILLDIVDMDRIGALTLAQHRRDFNDEQFKEFTELLSQLLFRTYIAHLEKYSNEKVVIDKAEEQENGRAKVATKTVSGDAEIPVEFSLFKNEDGEWKLYDVTIEGVSLIKNFRSQFKSMLMNKKPEQFIQELRQKVQEQAQSDQKDSGGKDSAAGAHPEESE
ncbi:ABC transporter substrate-binding protein [Candidatus Sumerlaeota bacterium]|nr:ABC transporter substrate-binding protein [Candidatus Sumerlaeota bacterium]